MQVSLPLSTLTHSSDQCWIEMCIYSRSKALLNNSLVAYLHLFVDVLDAHLWVSLTKESLSSIEWHPFLRFCRALFGKILGVFFAISQNSATLWFEQLRGSMFAFLFRDWLPLDIPWRCEINTFHEFDPGRSIEWWFLLLMRSRIGRTMTKMTVIYLRISCGKVMIFLARILRTHLELGCSELCSRLLNA